MSTTTRIVFFGSSDSSAQVLTALVTEPSFKIVAVVTKPIPTNGHTSTQDTPVAKVAQSHNLTLLRPHKTDEIISHIKPLAPTLGVLFAYGQILSDDLLHTFPRGIVNIHPSLLPHYRGPSPIEAAILAGDTTVGTSIMLIDTKMDQGPILAQKSWSTSPLITKPDLTAELVSASLEMLVPSLHDYISGKISPQPQDDTQATYCSLIKKTDGYLDISSETATTLSRKVRAYAGWPAVTIDVTINARVTPLKLHAITITDEDCHHDTAAIRVHERELLVDLPTGTIRIDKAQLPGRAIVHGTDLCNGPTLSLASA